MLDLEEPDNAPRFRLDDPRGHVESYFLKANSPGGNRAIWIKHTVRIPAGKPEQAVAEVWAVAFHRKDRAFPVAVKATTPLASARFRASPFRAEHDFGVFEGGRARGEIASHGHTIGWTLEFDGAGPTHYPFPLASMYSGAFPRTKSLTPVPDAAVLGAVEVDGQRWMLSGWRGMQGHNWGREHAPAYAWIHCSSWEDGEPGFVEGMTGRVRVGSARTPWLTVLAVNVGGRTYRFDGPRAMLLSDPHVDPQHFRFRAKSRDAELTGVVLARREEMAGLVYDNPDGSRVYCLNSKIASARFVLERKGAPPVELRSRQCALEVGTARVDHGVKILA
jgi:hypothetical protein